MAEKYTITLEDTVAQRAIMDPTVKPAYTGVLIHIRPPVLSLNSDGVERYLAHRRLEPVERDLLEEKTDIVVLGSTDEQTTIYASVLNDEVLYGQLRQELANATARYLGFMGAQAAIETPFTP